MLNTVSKSANIMKTLSLLCNPMHNAALDKFDHQKTYKEAISHGVTGLIHEKISTYSNNSFPQEFTKALGQYHNNYKILNNFIDAEATKVLKQLKKEQIEVVVLKGFALAYQVYSEPSLRPKTDIDIIIRPQDSDKIKQILQSLGYTNPRGWEPKAIINQFSYKKTLGKGISVFFDIHLKISNSKTIENILNYDELLASADTNTIDGLNLINKPYALTHAVFHLLGHKASGDMVKLIWYYDIHLLITAINQNEKNELITLIRNTGLANLMTHILTLTEQYFPSNALTSLLDNLKDLPFNNTFNYLLGSTSGAKGLWLTIKATKGLRGKINIIQETAFPPAAEIYIKYGKQTKWPLGLLYIRRIISGSIKYLFNKNKNSKN